MVSQKHRWLKKLLHTTLGCLAFLLFSTAAFAAAPTLSSQSYMDSNGDGKIETLRLTFDQTIATCTATVADFTYTANDITGSAIAGGTVSCTGSDANVDITLGTTGNADITSHSTAPTIAYTDNVARELSNGGAEQVATFGAQNLADGAGPHLISATFSTNIFSKNILTLVYTEALVVSTDGGGDADLTNNNSTTSTASLGDMTTARTIAGIVTWTDGAGSSNYANAATGANVVSLSETTVAGDTISIGFNNTAGSFFITGSVAPNATTMTPVADTNDITDAAGNAVATGTASGTHTAWDSTAPTALTGFKFTGVGTGETSATLQWDAHASLSDFANYIVAYKTSAGVTLADSIWGATDDSNLSNISNGNGTTITSLTKGGIYNAIAYAVDNAGNVSSGTPEVNFLVASNTDREEDTTGPEAPGSFTVTLNDDLHPVLSWTNPTDEDLQDLQIVRSKGQGVDPTSEIALISKSNQTYTDTTADQGNVYNYKIRGIDSIGNTGTFSAVASITTEEGSDTEEAVTSIVVELKELSTSGQSGTATLSETENGDLTVTIDVTPGAEGQGQPVHIHAGTCSELGGIEYNLLGVFDGASTTTFEDLSLGNLKSMGDLAINGHLSGLNLATYVFCGDIVIPDSVEAVTVEESTEDEEDSEEETNEQPEETDDDGDEDHNHGDSQDHNQTNRFTDTETHFAKKEINELADREVLKGDPDGKFRPEGLINRAEAAALFARVLGQIEPGEAQIKPYEDVEIGAWYAGYVNYLRSLNLLDPNKTNYNPGNQMNRAEFLTLTVSVFNHVAPEELQLDTESGNGSVEFSDVDSSDWFNGVFGAAKTAGFIEGVACGDNRCGNPGQSITRGEAAVIINNAFYDGNLEAYEDEEGF